MPSTSSSHRIFYLDLLRTFAIVSIVFTHTVYDTWPEAQYQLVALFLGSAALFFMTSGAMIFPLTEPAHTFYRRRLRSYLPQLLLWSVVYFLLEYYMTGAPWNIMRKEAQWAFFSPTFGPGWFLYALTGLYLFAPVVSPWLQKASRRQVEWFLAAWGISGLTLLAREHVPLEVYQTPVAPFFGYLGFMVAGFYLHRWPVAQRSRRARISLWAVLVAVGILFALRAYVTARRWGFADLLYQDVSVNVMAMCMLWFALASLVKTAPQWLRRPITVVSTASLGIYLWHWALLRYAFPPQSMADGTRFLLALAISLLMTLLCRRAAGLFSLEFIKFPTINHKP